jgi:DNA-directed RNA polymerase specialized sigma24 family protein
MLRYQKRFIRTVDADDLPASADNFGKTVEAREIIKLVFKAQGKRVRDAAYYTYVEEFDQREIQKITGQSPATIRRNLSRFKKSLASLGKKLAM